MKLRVRSLETKETIKIDTPNPCPVRHLKALIAARVSAPPGSLHLSLNRKDEIDVDVDGRRDGSSSPDLATIESLGLISGDLVFYTTNPLAFSGAPGEGVGSGGAGKEGGMMVVGHPGGEVEFGGGSNVAPLVVEMADADSGRKEETECSRKAGSGAQVAELVMEGVVDSDEDLALKECVYSFSIPGFLKRVMEEEAGVAVGDLGLLVIAVHAVFLEFGFLVCGGDGSRLPEGWAVPKGAVIVVSYTLPGLENVCGDAAVAPSISVKFTQIGNFVNVYGSVGGDLGVHRVSIGAWRFVSSLALSVDKMDKKDEERVLELWKMVKDGLSLPLLIDVSEKYGLSSPPCLTRLPTDLKSKILELIPGVDLARVGCVNMELRYLSSNDELWGKKFIEEFEYTEGKGLFGRRWKDKFVICWVRRKKDSSRRFDNGSVIGMPRPCWKRTVRFAAPGFNIIGGDYDRFPVIGGIGAPGSSGMDIPRLLHRQNFLPRCNFGGF